LLDEEMPLVKKSKRRLEIEALLAKKGLILEENVSVMNLESKKPITSRIITRLWSF